MDVEHSINTDFGLEHKTTWLDTIFPLCINRIQPVYHAVSCHCTSVALSVELPFMYTVVLLLLSAKAVRQSKAGDINRLK